VAFDDGLGINIGLEGSNKISENLRMESNERYYTQTDERIKQERIALAKNIEE